MLKNAVYLRDYDLGDIVNIKSHKWGIITQARITEINEIYENNGMKISVVFGYEKPIKLIEVKIWKNLVSSVRSGESTAADGRTFCGCYRERSICRRG